MMDWYTEKCFILGVVLAYILMFVIPITILGFFCYGIYSFIQSF